MRVSRFLATFLLVGCHQSSVPPRPSAPAVSAASTRTESYSSVIVVAQDEIRPDTLGRIGNRVGALRTEPTVLHLRVGDTISLTRQVRVVVLDSAGAVLGRTPVYDIQMLPGAAALAEGRRIVGRSVGESRLTIHFPSMAWPGAADARPATVLLIQVASAP